MRRLTIVELVSWSLKGRASYALCAIILIVQLIPYDFEAAARVHVRESTRSHARTDAIIAESKSLTEIQSSLRAPAKACERLTFPLNRKLRDVTNPLEEPGVNIMAEMKHSDHGKRYAIGSGTLPGIGSTLCDILNPKVWIECAEAQETGKNSTNLGKSSRFCTSSSIILELPCVFVEMWGSVHRDVPGAVFDAQRIFRHQHYVRTPDTSIKTAHRAHYKRLAVAVFPYMDAPGHFPHETLPKVLWLLQTLPADVPVLAPVTTWTMRYYDALASQGVDVSRLIPFHVAPNSVITVERLYTAVEWPFCPQDGNPNHGGEPSEYPYEVMSSLRATIVPESLKALEAKSIVVIDRGQHKRRYVNHEKLVNELKTKYSDVGYIIEEFGQSELEAPLSSHIAMFNRAAIVIGPHGAGFSNLIFCREGTAVIELGFDSAEGMQLDEMYFQLSLGLHLRYWLVMGKGSYLDRIDVDTIDVLTVVHEALSGASHAEQKSERK